VADQPPRLESIARGNIQVPRTEGSGGLEAGGWRLEARLRGDSPPLLILGAPRRQPGTPDALAPLTSWPFYEGENSSPG